MERDDAGAGQCPPDAGDGDAGDGDAPREAADFKLTLRRTSSGKIIGQHPRIREVLETIERVAPTDVTVLVTGESGTGKEAVVAALHDASKRARGPFKPINCATITGSLIESELFGHKKGAFTGAESDKKGLIAYAEGGTLFLDEIAELPLGAQAKFLRVLQNHEYSPVGDPATYRCNIRVVAATNRDLAAEVAAGRFREDLFYRLNVVPVALPPLRERGSDIDLLAIHFLRKTVAEFERPEMSFDPEALAALRRWPWKGNIRELENEIRRVVAICRSPVVTVGDLQRDIREHHRAAAPGPATTAEAEGPFTVRFSYDDAQGIDLTAAVAQLKQAMLIHALVKANGNSSQAARNLRLKRTTFLAMLKQCGIEP
jgi:sigma-54 specific flagellar transcriptional regulator A